VVFDGLAEIRVVRREIYCQIVVVLLRLVLEYNRGGSYKNVSDYSFKALGLTK
jgi:hypothetical protein